MAGGASKVSSLTPCRRYLGRSPCRSGGRSLQPAQHLSLLLHRFAMSVMEVSGPTQKCCLAHSIFDFRGELISKPPIRRPNTLFHSVRRTLMRIKATVQPIGAMRPSLLPSASCLISGSARSSASNDRRWGKHCDAAQVWAFRHETDRNPVRELPQAQRTFPKKSTIGFTDRRRCSNSPVVKGLPKGLGAECCQANSKNRLP